eukprot:1955405-Prorocentrum_lima.AAC.1
MPSSPSPSRTRTSHRRSTERRPPRRCWVAITMRHSSCRFSRTNWSPFAAPATALLHCLSKGDSTA